jgi:photosystem II stability/assembly factor-like uncharacterized protein
MKNIVNIALLLLIVSQICFAGWQIKQPLTNLNQNAVCYSGTQSTFILCDQGNLLFSRDSGINWNVSKLTENSKLNAIYFLDEEVSFIVGDKGKIFRTDNAWNDWTDISIPDYFHLNDVAFNDYERGVIVGTKEVRIDGRRYFLPSIQTTINGGSSWTEIKFDFKGKLNSVAYFTEKDIWAVGDEGSVFKSTDYGHNWSKETMDLTSNLNSIRICPDHTAMIAGDLGVFLYSYDLGELWIRIPMPEYYNITSACFREYREIITAGTKEVRIDGKRYNMATILSLAPGERQWKWKEEFCVTEGSYNSISFCKSNIALAVGDAGVIAHFNTLTSADVKVNSLHDNFQFEQNYPNPFNPTTFISFSIPHAAFITLIVYDILGNEVANLVNDYKDAGNYKLNFDASKLSSGIYIYRLQANNFTNSKRMMLLK